MSYTSTTIKGGDINKMDRTVFSDITRPVIAELQDKIQKRIGFIEEAEIVE